MAWNDSSSARPRRVVDDKYEVLEPIGRGSMGAVYVARHTLTDNLVALKLITPSPSASSLVHERFRREVRVSGHVKHDGIVKVHDAGVDYDGVLYLAMELLSGENLHARSSSPSFSQAYGLKVLQCMLEPLAAAHDAGIVHRDIKPENIFLHRLDGECEQVKLLDFGIVRNLSDQSGTRSDVGLGTPYYMSPEQATNAREVEAPADVWSVGVMLYWLLTGGLPFEGTTPFNTLTMVCMRPHPALDAAALGADPALVDLVERTLKKDPNLRPPNARVLADELAAIIGPIGSGPHAELRSRSHSQTPIPVLNWAASSDAGYESTVVERARRNASTLETALISAPARVASSTSGRPTRPMSAAKRPAVPPRSSSQSSRGGRIVVALVLMISVVGALGWWQPWAVSNGSGKSPQPTSKPQQVELRAHSPHKAEARAPGAATSATAATSAAMGAPAEEQESSVSSDAEESRTPARVRSGSESVRRSARRSARDRSRSTARTSAASRPFGASEGTSTSKPLVVPTF